MNRRYVPPHATALIESLRGLGYTLPTALADLVDNSISAGASNVDIHFEWKGAESWVRVLDDGRGMTDPQLEEAMRLGARDPRETRSSKDLGRFGMGLKTASFSQARRLTVASKTSGSTSINCLRWDLDLLAEAGGDWSLLEGPADETADAIQLLERTEKGTAVVIDKLDRIVSNGFKADHLFELIDQVEQSLAMTFHRLIEGPNAELTLRLNGKKIVPWDPFMTGHTGKAWESPEYDLPGPEKVTVQCHVLPHMDRLTTSEAERAAGPAGWSSQQGFYIYRERRLLVAGGWLRLGDRGRNWTREEPYRLARIRVDIPNAADFDWKINVLKSTATPPVRLKPDLLRLGGEARERSRNVFAHRGRVVSRSTGPQGGLPDVWDVVKNRRSTSYRVNRDHDLIRSVLTRSGSLRKEIEAVIRLIEETVPVQRIWLDTAEDSETPVNEFAERSENEVLEVLQIMFETLVHDRGLDVDVARARLLRTRPFDGYPALVASLQIQG